MAKRRATDGGVVHAEPSAAPTPAAAAPAPAGNTVQNLIRTGLTHGTTGRYLVLFQPGGTKAGVRALRGRAGVRTVSTAESSSGALPPGQFGDRQTVLERLGLAIVSMTPDQSARVAAAPEDSGFQTVIPECLMYLRLREESANPPPPGAAWSALPELAALPPTGLGTSFDYQRGYRDAVARLLDLFVRSAPPGLGGGPGLAPPAEPAPPGFPSLPGEAPPGSSSPAGPSFPPPGASIRFNEAEATWGLQATGVLQGSAGGRDVRLAILDTGLDLGHPDFQDGRVLARECFIEGEAVQDGHGHGTHCAGTACGPRRPADGAPRYGVACEARLCVGKVLPDGGRLTVDTWATPEGIVVEGIEWALTQGCKVISISLESPAHGPDPDPLYEAVGRRALRLGALIIAAAGNGSARPYLIRPVSKPANSTAVVAVGAVDQHGQIAPFSNRGLFPPAGAIDLVAPGVSVFSSWPLPIKNKRLSGTSMAVPHTAGVAALLAQANPKMSPVELREALRQRARSLLPLDVRDVGSGLVQA